jgi:hypothetical protein
MRNQKLEKSRRRKAETRTRGSVSRHHGTWQLGTRKRTVCCKGYSLIEPFAVPMSISSKCETVSRGGSMNMKLKPRSDF